MKNPAISSATRARGFPPSFHACGVEGCETRPTVAVSGTESTTTFMCLRHATAWSESSLCRDVAQHDSSASHLALSTWLNLAGAGALATEWS